MTGLAHRSRKHRYVTLAANASDSTFWSPFLGGGTDYASPPLTHESAFVWSGSNSSTGSSADPRDAQFSAIQEALFKMGRLPDGHDFFVDGQITKRASDLLAAISQNFEMEPPKVLPQDGEAVIFTWEFGPVKRYLTIDDEDVSLMDVNRTVQARCHHDVPKSDDEQYSMLINLLHVSPQSRSNLENDV